MTLYLLTDWEVNGYSDSDFWCTYYNTEDKTVHACEYGSTRYAGARTIGWNGNVSTVVINGEHALAPTAEIVEEARQWLEGHIFERMVELDKRLVDEPNVEDLHPGLEVRLLADCKMQVNETEKCLKCGGSGHWTNPRNSADKRDCFGCKGTGTHVSGKKKVDGKLVYDKLSLGTHGSVVDWRSFGKFYSNGYNKPNRHNTSVQFRLEDGKVVRASLEKLRLHREYTAEHELRAKAKELSFSYGFSAIYPRHAWDCHNFAAQVAKR